MVSHSEIHEYNMRDKNQLVLPSTRKPHSDTQTGFLFQGIKEWDNLTEEMKSTNSSRLLGNKEILHRRLLIIILMINIML